MDGVFACVEDDEGMEGCFEDDDGIEGGFDCVELDDVSMVSTSLEDEDIGDGDGDIGGDDDDIEGAAGGKFG